MTDNEIIKALECCIADKCMECPLRKIPKVKGCMNRLSFALDLINRQKAEIERLEKEVVDRDKIIDERGNEVIRYDNAIRFLHKQLETIRSKAIKEFAKRVKESSLKIGMMSLTKEGISTYVSVDNIDNLVKEMTEGQDAGKGI